MSMAAALAAPLAAAPAAGLIAALAAPADAAAATVCPFLVQPGSATISFVKSCRERTQ